MWVTCNGLAQIAGSLLMYGIGTSPHITLAPWRAMFIIAGSITVFAGLLFFFLMPANVDTAWFLTPEERIVASKRLAGQHDGGDKVNFSMRQLKEACLDVRTFITFCFGLLITINSIVLTVSTSEGSIISSTKILYCYEWELDCRFECFMLYEKSVSIIQPFQCSLPVHRLALT